MNVLYSAMGCTRCKLVKAFMDERNIEYVEKDIKVDGKEDFQLFYKQHRSAIYRSADGIEFPVFSDGIQIRQGITSIIAYLLGGEKLGEFFRVGTMKKEWIDGIFISRGDEAYRNDFIEVLRYLKHHNMKLHVITDGRNAKLLKMAIEENLIDRLQMDIFGDEKRVQQVLGEKIVVEDIKDTMQITAQSLAHKFVIQLMAPSNEDSRLPVMTPDEAAAAAKFLEESTGTKKNKVFIKADEKAGLDNSALLTYKNKVRSYQVFVDIEKA